MLHARQLQHISISDKFNSGKFDYGKQFSGLYWLRLESLRPALCSKLPADVQYVDKLFEIQPETRCVIIGTLYMEMKLKPNVLEDIENDVCFALCAWLCKCLEIDL
jgi:DNA polymerase delta subunit 2